MSPDSARDPETLRRALGAAPLSVEARGRIVEGALARARVRRTRRVAARRWAFVGGATALLLLGLGVGLRAAFDDRGSGGAGGRLATSRVGGPAPRPYAAGAVLGTRHEKRAVAIGPHRVELSPWTSVRLLAPLPSVRLEIVRGRARYTVSPLGRGETFVVQTRHVRVTVVGTSFEVSLSHGCTGVEVLSGRVRLTPLRRARPQDSEPAQELGRGERRTVCEPPAIPKELDPAGQQVQRAISLSQSGENLTEAEALLASYLAAQPDGPYGEEAHYFLVLVKQRMGKTEEALEQARAFLARFPATSRAEALRLWLKKKKP